MTRKRGYVYDFPSRVEDFRKRWSRLFTKLVGLGYPEEKLFFQVKIENVEKEDAIITISHELATRFIQAQKDKKIVVMLKSVVAYAHDKFDGGPVKIVGNRIFARGECGLSYVAHVFPLIYQAIEEQLLNNASAAAEEKKRRVVQTKKQINDYVESLVLNCGLKEKVAHYVYYDKGIFHTVIKRTRGRRHLRTMKITISGESFLEIERDLERWIKEICVILDGVK